MPKALPPRASLDWLRKTAKQNLKRLRESDPAATLASAQLALAREYGFASWRVLKAKVEAVPGEEVIAAFLRLVGEGELSGVRAALAATPNLVNAVGSHPFWGGRPQPLHVAIETGRRDMFDLLLAAGAEVNGRNAHYDLWSPLMLAIQRGHDEMRDALIARGARIGLVEALMMGDDARADALLAAGLPAQVPNGGSLLAFARTPFAIDRLLALGASAIATDRWGIAPIEAMSRAGPDGPVLVRHMMIRGVAPGPEEFARLGDQGALATLIAADPAAAKADAVLMGAVGAGHRDLAGWLIEQGADANARAADRSRQTVLHEAAWRGDLDMVRLLVAAGADIAARDGEHDNDPEGWARVALTVTNNPRCAEVADWLAARAKSNGSL